MTCDLMLDRHALINEDWRSSMPKPVLQTYSDLRVELNPIATAPSDWLSLLPRNPTTMKASAAATREIPDAGALGMPRSEPI